MIKIEKTEVVGWEAAIRGMRNPMNSWDKSDSYWYSAKGPSIEEAGLIDPLTGCHKGYEIGDNDHDLMMKLRNAGTDHRKFMRMIVVYLDITAPLYWWKEFDTYKVGTVANSCSTMHKIHEKEFTLEDFSHEKLIGLYLEGLKNTILLLNIARNTYIYGGEILLEDGSTMEFEAKNKTVWEQMIQLLPSSYNQKRTVMLSYEVLANIYKSRKNHKLDEWRAFCAWIESLPYSELITGGRGDEAE